MLSLPVLNSIRRGNTVETITNALPDKVPGRQLDQSALVVVGGLWALASTTSLCVYRKGRQLRSAGLIRLTTGHSVPDAYYITTNIDGLLSVERLGTTKDMSRNVTTQRAV